MRKLTPFFMVSPKAATMAKYWITLLVLTVFPAPDSPLTHTHTHVNVIWMKWSEVLKLGIITHCYVVLTLCLISLLCVYVSLQAVNFLLISSWYLPERKKKSALHYLTCVSSIKYFTTPRPAVIHTYVISIDWFSRSVEQKVEEIIKAWEPIHQITLSTALHPELRTIIMFLHCY